MFSHEETKGKELKISNIYKLQVGEQTFKCCVGRSGIKSDKKEDDGATPEGEFPLRCIYYRSDRINRNELTTLLDVIEIEENDGWCDDVNSSEYNKHVKLPFNGRHEQLWLKDHVYDIIVVIDYNVNPIEKGKGSAIFMHIARENYTPTLGCVALSKEDLLQTLKYLSPETKIKINTSGITLINALQLQLNDKKRNDGPQSKY